MIYKILKQNNLYHNPDPLFRLVGEANESVVIVEGQEARALLDSWFTVISYFIRMGKETEIKTTTVTFNFTNRGFRRIGSALSGLCGGSS